MKKFLLIILVLPLFFACSEDPINDIIPDSEVSQQKDPLLTKLIQNGYDKDDIKEYKSYFLVEGDIVFYKNRDYKLLDNAQNKQRRYPYTSVSIKTISIYINPNMNFNWRSAASTAIDRWNNLNSGVTLQTTTSQSTAHIQIMYDSQDPNMSLDPNVFGRGDWPTSSGLPGTKIWVNPDFNPGDFCINTTTVTQAMRITNIQHELGHNLGLTHTNSSDGNLIPGTPTNDSSSVMNGGQACTLDGTFSANDITAINYLFPPLQPSVNISGPVKGNNSGYYTWTANIQNAATPSTFTWKYSYDGVNYNSTFVGTTQSVSANLPLDKDLFLKVTVNINGTNYSDTHLTMNSDAGTGGPGHP